MMLGDWAEFLAAAAAEHEAVDLAVEHCARLIAARAKNLIGHEHAFWPPLAESTLAQKAANTPLLESGELRDSIEWSAPHHEGFGETVGYVGSNNPKAAWHEMGTKHIPPRPFIGAAARMSEHKIYESLNTLVGAMALKGFDPLRALEILHHLWRELKESELVKSAEEGSAPSTGITSSAQRHSGLSIHG
jgi:phage gpG-like protein